jgi:hypothetical protein
MCDIEIVREFMKDWPKGDDITLLGLPLSEFDIDDLRKIVAHQQKEIEQLHISHDREITTLTLPKRGWY